MREITRTEHLAKINPDELRSSPLLIPLGTTEYQGRPLPEAYFSVQDKCVLYGFLGALQSVEYLLQAGMNPDTFSESSIMASLQTIDSLNHIRGGVLASFPEIVTAITFALNTLDHGGEVLSKIRKVPKLGKNFNR